MTELEKQVSGQLRERALREVESRGFTDDQLAEVLDVFPDGARRLRHQPDWPLGTSLSVLDKMGLTVKISVD